MPQRTIGFFPPPRPLPTDDTNGDGYLTRSEFRNFITELSNVGGNIKQLEAAKDGGCCWCLPLPQHDLFSYVESFLSLQIDCPHPLLFVVSPPSNDLRIQLIFRRAVWFPLLRRLANRQLHQAQPHATGGLLRQDQVDAEAHAFQPHWTSGARARFAAVVTVRQLSRGDLHEHVTLLAGAYHHLRR